MKRLMSMGIVIIVVILFEFIMFSIAKPADLGLDKTLRATESIIKGVETSGVYGIDADTFDRYLDESVKRIMEVYKESKGNKIKLIMLANQIRSYKSEFKNKNFENRLKLIDSKVKSGEILLSKRLLQRMSESQIRCLKSYITPRALEKYKTLHPMIFRPLGKIKPRSSIDSNALSQDGEASSWIDLFVTPVYAGVVTEAACFACKTSYDACKVPCQPLPWCGPACKVCKWVCYEAFLWCLEPCARAEAEGEEAKPAKKADLVIKDWWVRPDANPGNQTNEVNSHQKYYVCFIVANVGSASTGPFVVQGGGLGIAYNPRQNHASLEPGQSRQGALKYPTTPASGTYRLEIMVDPDNNIPENNEDNNRRVEAIKILPPRRLTKEAEHVARPVKLPDLVVTSVECHPDKPYGKLAFTVANRGNAPLREGRHIAHGMVIGPGGPSPASIGKPIFVEISLAGAKQSFNLDLMSPIATTGGGIQKAGGTSTYVTTTDIRRLYWAVTVTVDSTNTVWERNETNNTFRSGKIFPCGIRGTKKERKHPKVKAIPKSM